jgi:uncharacterized protein YndB with AHSA1/START domain
MIFKALFGKKDDGPATEVGGTKDLLTLAQAVPAPADRAFAVFVDEFDRWWPRDYTWGKDKLATIGIEPKMGGRCFETLKDGSEQVWGKVLAFDRPNHIVLAWQIDPDRTPVDGDGAASRVDVRFSPDGPDKTNVLLVHRDFFRHQGDWEKYRAEMASKKGWPAIMAAYAAAFG